MPIATIHLVRPDFVIRALKGSTNTWSRTPAWYMSTITYTHFAVPIIYNTKKRRSVYFCLVYTITITAVLSTPWILLINDAALTQNELSKTLSTYYICFKVTIYYRSIRDRLLLSFTPIQHICPPLIYDWRLFVLYSAVIYSHSHQLKTVCIVSSTKWTVLMTSKQRKNVCRTQKLQNAIKPLWSNLSIVFRSVRNN